MNGLSIIVPAHDNAVIIIETLASIERATAYLRDQSPAGGNLPCDVVVVDDGSRDETYSTVSEFARGKPHYVVIRRATPSSAGCARNTGVACARGDVLFFLDGDDQFLEPHLHVCCEVLADTSVDFVKTAVLLDDPVHPDWEGRIANSLVINLAIPRRCHEFVGGFLDFHLCRRSGDSLVPALDIFRSIEDVYYNRAISKFFKGVRSPLKTVRYARYPGNSFDRQYEKFQARLGDFRERLSEERKMQIALADLISQQHFAKLAKTARPARD